MSPVADIMMIHKCNAISNLKGTRQFSVRRHLRHVWKITFDGAERFTPASKFLSSAFEGAALKSDSPNNLAVYNWTIILDEFSLTLSLINLSTLSQVDSSDLCSRTTSVMLGALSGHINAVRSLVLSGFDVHARIINRSISEHIDLTILTVHDPEFCKSYVDAEEHADANKFWHKNVSKGKIRNAVKNRIDNLSAEVKESYQEMAAYIKAEEEMMGAALHPSYLSAAMIIGMGMSHGQGGIGMFGVIDAASARTLQFLFCRLLELFVLCRDEIRTVLDQYSSRDFPANVDEIKLRFDYCINLGLYISAHRDKLPLTAE